MDIKQVQEEAQKLFHDFKEANEQRLKALEENGHKVADLEEKTDKVNEALGKALDRIATEKERADRLETAIKRGAIKDASGEDAEAKARILTNTYGAWETRREFSAEMVEGHRKAFNLAMRKGDKGLGPDEFKLLSVDSNPDGGYIVTPDMNGRIVQFVYETSPMRQVASVQPISSDSLEGLYDLDETDFGWVGERQSRTDTDTPELGRWRIEANEMYAQPVATQKLLDDASVNVEDWLAGKVADRFSRAENRGFVLGTGVQQPRGFLTYPNGVPTATAYKVIEQVPTGAAGVFAASSPADVFVATTGKLKDNYHARAHWAMNRTTWAESRKLKDGQGMYLFQMDFASGAAGTILGYPIIRFEDMPNGGTGAVNDTNLAIAFGDFSAAYQVVDRIGVRVLRDPYTTKGVVKFYSTKRVGGDVINFEAIKLIRFGA